MPRTPRSAKRRAAEDEGSLRKLVGRKATRFDTPSKGEQEEAAQNDVYAWPRHLRPAGELREVFDQVSAQEKLQQSREAAKSRDLRTPVKTTGAAPPEAAPPSVGTAASPVGRTFEKIGKVLDASLSLFGLLGGGARARGAAAPHDVVDSPGAVPHGGARTPGSVRRRGRAQKAGPPSAGKGRAAETPRPTPKLRGILKKTPRSGVHATPRGGADGRKMSVGSMLKAMVSSAERARLRARELLSSPGAGGAGGEGGGPEPGCSGIRIMF